MSGSDGRPPTLRVSDLRVRLGGARGQLVVDGLCYELTRGRTLAIIGESGSGKTVGARAVMGLLPRHASVAGSVQLEGEELLGRSAAEIRKYRGPGVAMVFQDPNRSLNPTMRIGDQIGEAVRLHTPLGRRAVRARVVELLEMVRLPAPRERAGQYPHQLSGGMRQRVMLAIALACRPKVLFADEATSALDVTTQAAIMELLVELQAELGMAMVMISHNLGLAASYADDVLVVYRGRTVEQGPVRTVFDEVRMPYTKLLLDSVPSLHAVLPDPADVVVSGPTTAQSGGCAFAPRCGRADDRCWAEPPPLVASDNAHRAACWHPLVLQVRAGVKSEEA